MLGGDLRRDTDWNDALPVHVQLLTTVYFYAIDSFQQMHGDEASMSQWSVCRVIRDVLEAITRRKREFIKFPTTREEIESTQQRFYEYCRYPGVIGAIDRTHVSIRSPGREQALYFLNRKKRYSINVNIPSV
ncbi:putative nuclease HARBI1 [Diadema setosum]|uniref:putative nuclease HARBI1 n=1 Tax=Diadema setosum TaxID=31175 RepID=UPI003B3B33C6